MKDIERKPDIIDVQKDPPAALQELEGTVPKPNTTALKVAAELIKASGKGNDPGLRALMDQIEEALEAETGAAPNAQTEPQDSQK